MRIVERERVVDIRVRPQRGERRRDGAERVRRPARRARDGHADPRSRALRAEDRRVPHGRRHRAPPAGPRCRSSPRSGRAAARPCRRAADGHVTAVGQAHAVGTGGSELHRADRVEARAARDGAGLRADRRVERAGLPPVQPDRVRRARCRAPGERCRSPPGSTAGGSRRAPAAGIRHQPGPARPAAAGVGDDDRQAGRRGRGARASGSPPTCGPPPRSSPGSAGSPPTDLPLLRDGQGVVHRTDDGLVATSLTGDVLRSVVRLLHQGGRRGRLERPRDELGLPGLRQPVRRRRQRARGRRARSAPRGAHARRAGGRVRPLSASAVHCAALQAAAHGRTDESVRFALRPAAPVPLRSASAATPRLSLRADGHLWRSTWFDPRRPPPGPALPARVRSTTPASSPCSHGRCGRWRRPRPAVPSVRPDARSSR